MMAFYLISTLLLVVALFRFHFSYVSLIIVSLLIYHVNIYINYSFYSDLVMRVIFFSTAAFSLPFLIARRTAPRLDRIELPSPESARRGFIAVFLLVLVFSAIHYSRVGLVVMNDNLDEARFHAIESGMFGIPSRVAIYGPSILSFLLLILLNARCINLKLFALSSLSIIVLLFLQGSKSSIAQYIVIAAISYNYLGSNIKRQVNWSAVIFLIVALMGFYYVFDRLNSIQDKDIISYVASRLTDISMTPVTALIEEPVRLYIYSPFMMVNDFLYPFAKIMNVAIESSNAQLSRYIYGGNPGDFSVPVTPGFIAYNFRDFGQPLCYLTAFLYGLICRHVYFRVGSISTIYAAWFILCVQYMLYVGLTSGNLFYLAPNFLAVFAGAYVIERLIAGRQTMSPAAPASAPCFPSAGA